MSHANNKSKKIIDENNRTTKSRKSLNARRKGNLQVLGNIGSGLLQTREDKGKIKNENHRITFNLTMCTSSICTTQNLSLKMRCTNISEILSQILNKSWRQQPPKQQLYSHLSPITNAIQVRRTRHVWHCWRSKDELISDVLPGTPLHERTKIWTTS